MDALAAQLAVDSSLDVLTAVAVGLYRGVLTATGRGLSRTYSPFLRRDSTSRRQRQL